MRYIYLLLLVNLIGCARPCCLHGCEIQQWKERANNQNQVYEDWLEEELGMEESTE